MIIPYIFCSVFLITSAIKIGNSSLDVQHEDLTAMFPTERTTLTDLGMMTIKMVEAMAKDSDAREVDLSGLTQLITSMSRASVFFDNPKEMRDYDLSNRLTLLEDKVNKEITKLQLQNEELKAALGNNSIGNHNSGYTGIHAYLTTSPRISSGTTIKFDQFMDNKGTGYDRSFGYYSCPVKGYYFISLSLSFSSVSSAIHIVLKVGEKKVINLYTKYTTTVSGSNVVFCKHNERITAVVTQGSANLYGKYGEPYNSLIVYLQQPGDKN